MVIITNYKSGDFYLKEYHIEFTAPKSKCCPVEFDMDGMNDYANYT